MYGRRYLLDIEGQDTWNDDRLAQLFIGGNEAFHIHLPGNAGPGLYAMIARSKNDEGDYNYLLKRTNGVTITLNHHDLGPDESKPLKHGDVIRIGDNSLYVRDERRIA